MIMSGKVWVQGWLKQLAKFMSACVPVPSTRLLRFQYNTSSFFSILSVISVFYSNIHTVIVYVN